MAASTYDEALRRLLLHEGGYTNHPSDPGGPTNYGITLGDYRKYVKPNAGATDVKAMKLVEAKAIYRAKYWNALACDEFPPGVDYAVFDYGVNSGIGRAGKVLRRCVGLPAHTHDVSKEVVAAVARHDAAALCSAICDERLAFLKRLKTWPVFGTGWSRRVAAVKAAALAMASGSSKPNIGAPARPSGKGVVPVNKAAQKGTAGGVVATGTAAAQQAQEAGAGATVLVVVVVITIALAIGTWLFWRRRQQRQQEMAAGRA